MITEQRILKIHSMKTREAEDGKIYLEGYFAKFNEPYYVCDDWVETILPGAFRDFLSKERDVKVLWNHNHDIVLGSTGNKTAMLKEDEVGLFGSVEINRADSEAMNAYARVSRGDVSGCSFGFDIGEMKEEIDDTGVYRTSIIKVNPLYEVSPCTFPAYPSTTISARCRERVGNLKRRKIDVWKKQMLKKIKEENK